MADQMVVVRWPNGAEGAVRPEAFGNPDLAENFKGAHILRWESGEPWEGPVTPEGMARKAEREVEARREARRERYEAREAARVVEVEVPAEPVSEREAKE